MTNEELLAAVDARFEEVARRLDENDRRWAAFAEVQRRPDIPLGPLDIKLDRLLERLRTSLNESDRPKPPST